MQLPLVCTFSPYSSGIIKPVGYFDHDKHAVNKIGDNLLMDFFTKPKKINSRIWRVQRSPESISFGVFIESFIMIKGKTSWGWAGPSSAQTKTGTLFYFIQDMLLRKCCKNFPRMIVQRTSCPKRVLPRDSCPSRH